MRRRWCLVSSTSSPSCNITSSCPKASTKGWRDTRPRGLFQVAASGASSNPPGAPTVCQAAATLSQTRSLMLLRLISTSGLDEANRGAVQEVLFFKGIVSLSAREFGLRRHRWQPAFLTPSPIQSTGGHCVPGNRTSTTQQYRIARASTVGSRAAFEKRATRKLRSRSGLPKVPGSKNQRLENKSTTSLRTGDVQSPFASSRLSRQKMEGTPELLRKSSARCHVRS